MTNSSRLTSKNNNPEIREQGGGGWGGVLFGLPFFLIGLLMVSYVFGFNPMQIENKGVPLALLVVIGLPFLVIGFFVIFGNSHIRIDRRQGLLTTSAGILFFVKRTNIPIQNILRVQFDYIPGDSETAKNFLVRLILPEPHPPVLFHNSSNYLKALAIAKDLSRFLDRPLEDISGGQGILLEPACLDESLRERVKRLGEDARYLPTRPVEMRTQIKQTYEGVALEIPSPWSSAFTKAVPLINERLAKTLVTASAAGLRIEGRASTSTKAGIQEHLDVEIPVAALRSLDVATALSAVRKNTPGRADGKVSELAVSIAKNLGSVGITVQSETEFIQFGMGLPEDEAVYLHALLKSVLVGR